MVFASCNSKFGSAFIAVGTVTPWRFLGQHIYNTHRRPVPVKEWLCQWGQGTRLSQAAHCWRTGGKRSNLFYVGQRKLPRGDWRLAPCQMGRKETLLFQAVKRAVWRQWGRGGAWQAAELAGVWGQREGRNHTVRKTSRSQPTRGTRQTGPRQEKARRRIWVIWGLNGSARCEREVEM